MKDVHNQIDDRQISIDEVGVSDLRYPIVVLDRAKERQHTIATLKMSVNLPHQFKGTHMSRFVEILHEYRGEITMFTLPQILHALRQRLSSESSRVEIRFPYFLERSAPVSGVKGMMDYECWFIGSFNGNKDDFVLGVRVPVTSLCPCSKEISDYGAHNQRGYISIEVRSAYQNGKPAIVWIEDLVEVAEGAASTPVYALLKRVDERHVTMRAYENPVFVEDMVRNVAQNLRENAQIGWFKVHAINHESIHNHGAFACIEWMCPS